MAKQVQLDANGKRKFSIRDSVAYAAGDLGCNMSFALKGTMALFWTQVMGLSLWYSLLLVIVQVWDAINDPLIGTIIDSDRRHYKRNKFLSYIWFGSIGLIVGGALCFLPFPGAPLWAKIVIFIAGYVVWDAFYTIANVPYGSLLSLISKEPADRASLSAWRSIGSMVGNMLPMVILPFIIYEEDGVTLNGNMVFVAALIMGVLGFICFQFMIRNTEIRVEEEIKVGEEQPKFNVFEALKNFCLNRPAVGATLAAMGMFIGMQGAATAVSVVFQTYFQNAQISGIVQMFSMIPILVFTPLARKMVTKYGKKELSVIGAICSICGGLALFIITPDNTALDLVFYVIAQLIYSLGLGIYSTVSWAMMGDAIDYNEWKTGKREEGVVYSLHSFFRKLAQGIGPAFALVIMSWLGYVNNDINEAGEAYINVEKFIGTQVPINLRVLVAALFLVAAVMQFVGLALVYNLDKKTLEKMNAELAERHVAAEAVEVAENA
ncbi:MAG: MFS transporter [Clostridia bacterium]|nr:MFS transporter [Clostridia bacterium]